MTDRSHMANRVLASIPAKDYKRLHAHLMTRDRVESDEFQFTQQFLAHMLGLRREGVTEAATALKERKLINYSRGKIQILDVRGLKKSSCSCYQIVKAVFVRGQG